jgi:hypothetical protein
MWYFKREFSRPGLTVCESGFNYLLIIPACFWPQLFCLSYVNSLAAQHQPQYSSAANCYLNFVTLNRREQGATFRGRQIRAGKLVPLPGPDLYLTVAYLVRCYGIAITRRL